MPYTSDASPAVGHPLHFKDLPFEAFLSSGAWLLHARGRDCCMHRALRAREELVTYFQQGVTTARQQLAAGQELTGVLGRLVSAQDEEGNRWVSLYLGLYNDGWP